MLKIKESSDYTIFYNKISEPFRKNAVLLTLLRLLYVGIPVATVIIYAGIIIYSYINMSLRDTCMIILVPLTCFIAVTILRKVAKSDRPYMVNDYVPLISKGKAKESFPSRHTASLAIIAMAGLKCSIWLGVILWCMTLAQAVVRVVAGVHYPKDVIAGMIISLIWGMIFFI